MTTLCLSYYTEQIPPFGPSDLQLRALASRGKHHSLHIFEGVQ